MKKLVLDQEASPDSERNNKERNHQPGGGKKDAHSADVDTPNNPPCPFGCQTKHLLTACPHYQTSTVDQRWEVVKKNQRCRKCLRSHHTTECKKIDGIICDECKKNHHRSLHNERKNPDPPTLDPRAPPFTEIGHQNCSWTTSSSESES